MSNINPAVKAQLEASIAGLVARLSTENLNEAEALALILSRFATEAEATAGTATDKIVSPATASQIATAKADAAVAALVGSAPEVLDTIQEIAAALNNDPNVINNLLTQVGTKETKADAAAKLVEAKAYADTVAAAAQTAAVTAAGTYTDAQLNAFAGELAGMFDAQLQ